MTEHEFIEQLSQALKSLPVEQKNDILGEYRSHFFEAKERGKSEVDVAAGFGDPKAIASTYTADYHFTQWQDPSLGQGIGESLYHLMRGLIIVFSVLFFNFFFMLWPILTAALFLVVAWIFVGLTTVLSVVLAVTGMIGGFAGVILPNISTQLALVFYALSAGLFSILVGYGLYLLSRLALHGLLRYIKINVNLVAA